MPEYTRQEIEIAIIAQFGSKKKLAKELGMSQSQLSRSLQKLSPAFIQRLKGIGLMIDNLISRYPQTKRNTYSEMFSIKPVIVGDTIETYPGLNLEQQIELLRNEINRLKKELEGCRLQLEQHKEITKKVNKQ